jgi:peroxiredoxin
MTDISPLVPRQPVPPLAVSLAGGGKFDLAAENPDKFILVAFYRGLHCPLCRKQLGELEAKLLEFDKRGVSVVAISADDAERAERAKTEWGLPNLRVGYGLPLSTARAFGLWISTSRGKTSAGVEETSLFNEPGLFLIKPDGTLYFASVQSMPFARPHFDDLIAGLDFVTERNYPARGDVVTLPAQAAK